MHPDLTPEKLLSAYAAGIFPMADDEGGLLWFAPDPRAIIDLPAFKTTRSLRAVVRRGALKVTVNRAFADVIDSCADRRDGTWISDDIREAYTALHELGFAHSVETWQGDRLVGGLYGVSLAGAFFGESMFHREPDASKVALVHLVARMRDRGLALLDVQFMTEHLAQFGAVEIPKADYLRRLEHALRLPVSFIDNDAPRTPDAPPDQGGTGGGSRLFKDPPESPLGKGGSYA